MGFSGFFVLAQTDVPVDRLEGVSGLGTVLHEAMCGAGWRLTQLDEASGVETGQLATLLAGATGRPALAIRVHDSDVGSGDAATPIGVTCSFHLNEELATEMFGAYGLTPRADNAAAVPKLVRWAQQAGLTASPHALVAAMAGDVGPFGEGVHDLMLALGVPAS